MFCWNVLTIPLKLVYSKKNVVVGIVGIVVLLVARFEQFGLVTIRVRVFIYDVDVGFQPRKTRQPRRSKVRQQDNRGVRNIDHLGARWVVAFPT